MKDLALICVIFSAIFSGVGAVVIRTNSGRVKGRLVSVTPNIEAYQFSSIRYATAPIGNLRYKKTVPVQPWSNVLDATVLPKICPQIPSSPCGGPVQLYESTDQSEDCLFLNIWVPRPTLEAVKNNQACERLPVYFYIHGGAYVAGGSNSPFNGSVIAALNNIIVVTIQYRLGSLGFGYLGTESMPGNMGLWDQLEALKWIHNNIGAFGGNDSRVTIGGESAGAGSVALHLLSPYSRQYFQGAVLQSGSAAAAWAANSPEKALGLTNSVFQMVASASCNQSGDIFVTSPPEKKLACLETIPAEVFTGVDMGAFLQNGGRLWAAVIDGKFVPREPLSMLKDGDFYHVPTLIGANGNEGSFFLSLIPQGAGLLATLENPNLPMDKLNFENYISFVDGLFAGGALFSDAFPQSPLSLQTLHSEYWPRNHDGYPRGVEVAEAAAESVGVAMMYHPTIVWANYSAPLSPVYAYHFNYVSPLSRYPVWMGAKHTAELAYVFGAPFFPDCPTKYTRDDKTISRAVMAYWANFVKFGNPNGLTRADAKIPRTAASLPKWPLLSDIAAASCVKGSYLDITAASMISQKQTPIICDLKAQEVTFWSDIYPQILAATS